ncbi:hypothetical protein [Hyalangium minutum]|uniref:hypothetical protein n=1 Tax=Hyalangium minutum TaxID=394096 RepID=UPI0012F74E9A|nr:hypothetical protein [Hyalangium minutum]
MAFLTLSMVWGTAPRAASPSSRMQPTSTDSHSPDSTKKHLPTALAVALRLYERLEYEQALEQLARSKSATWDTDVRVLAWLYEGIILANLGYADRSREAFREGLRLHPSSVLPIEVSPKIAQLFQDVRHEVQQETSASPLPKALELPSVPPVDKQAEQSPPSIENHNPSPEPRQAEATDSSPKLAPWAPTSPSKPEESRFVKSHHVAFALGGLLASTGIVLLATMGSAHPEDKSTHLLTGSIAVVGGLNLIAFGATTAMGQRSPQTVGPLQRRYASVGAQLSF